MHGEYRFALSLLGVHPLSVDAFFPRSDCAGLQGRVQAEARPTLPHKPEPRQYHTSREPRNYALTLEALFLLWLMKRKAQNKKKKEANR